MVAQEVLAERKMDGVGCKKRKKMQWEIRKLLLPVTVTLRGSYYWWSMVEKKVLSLTPVEEEKVLSL
ncbi:hypothetical protein OIU84_027466 [Salix udensis]|uniref:Uncharacterized protein n=1 Tax=Salix udensis TaxID=889485 RepID=A0AAD6KFF2_9ROSI|nr:hypothetical protein OIU84_027466 [Salix udensis]